MNSDIKHVEWSSVELNILNTHSGQKSFRLLWGCLKKAERRYPDNLTIVWKLRFLKQHFSYLMNDPSLLEKGWMAYQQGIMAQLRLQIEFWRRVTMPGLSSLKNSKNPETLKILLRLPYGEN